MLLKNRLSTIDGLRAIAVLGVVWVHIWSFFGNLPMLIRFNDYSLDINKMIAPLGQGVDVFFVISGFCIYNTLTKKDSTTFSIKSYTNFIKSRWFRIAPAYYLVLFIMIVFHYVDNNQSPDLLIIIKHFFFFQTVPPSDNIYCPPFWSLAIEWHFYLLVPFFLLFTKKIGFYFVLTTFIFTAILLRLCYYKYWENENTDYYLYVRFIQFLWGIAVAQLYKDKYFKLPKILSGFFGFLLGFSIFYFGRILRARELVFFAGEYGFILKAVADPLLTLGVALAMLNLIFSESLFRKIFENKFFVRLGKISFSMYLWHWLVAYLVSQQVIIFFGQHASSQYIALLFTLLILYPISNISYYLLEEPYFKYSDSTLK